MHGRAQDRWRRNNYLVRSIAILLCLVTAFSVTTPAWGFSPNYTAVSESILSERVNGGAAINAENGAAVKDGTPAAGAVSYASAFGKVADPDTSQAIFAADTRENGRLWTDKTVNADRVVFYDGAGKPAGGMEAAADEFLVTLSAMSQSYQETTAFAEPSDTVFVIDVSASMFQNKLNNGDSRVKVMVEALNEAIAMLMDGHPDNRIAVVAFGGLPVPSNEDSQSRICKVLELGRYEGIPNNEYFLLESPAYIRVNNSIGADQLIEPSSRRIRVYGGTSTQHGIYAGAQILLNNPKAETVYQVDAQNTVIRKPNIILLTDGEPTMGWTDYRFADPLSDTPEGFDSGDANTVDMGLDILTVLTASYFKKEVHDYYYGEDDTARTAGFYSIGLDVADSEDARAIMDPLGTTGGQINAAAVGQSSDGKNYNMKTVLDDFVVGGRTVFPTLVKYSGKRWLATIDNVDHEVLSYDFADLFVTPTTVEQLIEAFRSVARQIISTASYPTKVDPTKTDYGGFVIFSDVLGQHMEFGEPKGLWFNNSRYTGAGFAQNVTQNSDGGATAKKFTESAFVRNALFGAAGADSITDPAAQAAIAALLESGLAAGDQGVYYRGNGDFGNRLTYYADDKCVWVGNYYNADGSVAAPPPTGAACIIDLYPVSAETQNTTNGEDSDLVYATFKVITALKEGDFREWNSDGTKLVRHLAAEQQMVRWYIPASLLPMRSVTPSYDNQHNVTGIHVTNTVPVRFIYSVGLKPDLALADVAQEYKDNNGNQPKDAYYFYTNDWKEPRNLAMASFIPNDTNPYYYYTAAEADGTGNIPLYTKTAGGYQPVTGGFQAGTDYYTRVGYYTAAAGKQQLEDYRLVADPGIIVQDSVPYIKAGAVKKAAISAATDEVEQGKQGNPTGTNNNVAEMAGFNLGQGLIRQRLLGNNGRLTVPFTKLTVTKEWDTLLNLNHWNHPETAGLIKTEQIQLYGDGTPVGVPQSVSPTDTNPEPLAVPNPTADAVWEELPVYRMEADGGGNTAMIQYTVAEGTWDGTDFVPYQNGGAPFLVSYSQPVWDPGTGKMRDARVNNYAEYDYQRYLVVDKLFEGLDPASVFQVGLKTINFDLYISAPGSGKYRYLGTMTYPDGFAAGQTVAQVVGNSSDPSFPPELKVDEVDFLLVEKNHQVDGYQWELSGEGAGVIPVSRPEELEVIYPGAPGNLHEITAADYAFALPGVANKETVSLKLTNRYQPVSRSFTLTKAYTGDLRPGLQDEIPDITFLVQGWATKESWAAGEAPIFADSTGSGLLKANGGSVTFPIDQQMEDLYAAAQGYAPIVHPQVLPEGYYRITEVNADGFEKEGYFYDAVLSAAADSSGVTVDNDPAAKSAGFYLTGGAPPVGIIMTNDYRVRPRLIIEKRFAGDIAAPVPAEIAADIYFTVTDPVSGKVLRTVPYEEFTGGQYILSDLPAGTYTVAEINQQSVPGYEPVVTSVESDFGKTGTVSLTGGDERVIFTNTYTQTPGTLTVRKELTGYPGDWGVLETTAFRVRIKDVTDADPAKHTYLILDQTNALSGTSATGGTVLEVSKSNPVLIQRLTVGHKYRVEEVKPAGAVYTVTYENEMNQPLDYITMATGNQTVNVINDYPRGTGNLIVTKELAGAYDDWGITAAKEFRFRVTDENGNYLLFIESPASRVRAAGDFYRCVGNSGDGVSEAVPGDKVIYHELTISAGAPVTLQNIWAGQAGEHYRIEEIIPPGEAGQYTAQSVQTVDVTLDQTAVNVQATLRNEYVQGQNNLTILKNLAGNYSDWAVDGDTGFQARLIAAEGPHKGEYLTFTNQQFTGSYSATGTYITFSANSPTTLTGIPSGSYVVEEASAGAHCTVTYSGLVSENGLEVVRLAGNGDSAKVTVTNTYAHDTGKLVIQKTLSGDAADWGVSNATVFKAKIYEETGSDKNLLYFVPAGGNTYRCVGSAAAVSEPGYENMVPDNVSLFDQIPFSGNEPAILENLWVGTKYFVEEEGGAAYLTTGYQNNGQEFPRDGVNAIGNITVNVINTYQPGNNSLILEKRLEGSYQDWGVDESSVLKANIFDITNANNEVKLSFVLTDTGVYNDVTGAVGNPQTVTESVSFSVREPAVVTGLPPGRKYEVREVADGLNPPYTVTYEGDQGAVLPVGVTNRVTAVNNYKPGQTALEIRKELSGAANVWNVSENTVFRAMVKCKEPGGNVNYISFPGGKTAQGFYHALGNSGSADAPTPENNAEDEKYVVEFTAGQPITITGLWPGNEYAVEEIPSAGAGAEYWHNGALLGGGFLLLEDGKQETVTVINVYADPDESLTIGKVLEGDYAEWGVDKTTLFGANIYDITANPAVKLNFEPAGAGLWQNLGGQITAAGTDTVTFSVAQPAKLTGLLPGHKYRILEQESNNYIAAYSANGDPNPNPNGNELTLASGVDDTVVVTNRYGTDAAALVIKKEISGNTGAWSATEYTDYTAMVKSIDSQGGERYIRFAADPAVPNNYVAADNNGPAEKPEPGDPDYDQYLITFSVKEPATLGGLWPGYRYVAEEAEVDGAATGYRNQSLLLTKGQVGTITVTNYYHTPGTTALMLRKDVSANAEDWGILPNQIFYVRLKYADGPHAGEYVMFPGGKSADDSYHAADPGLLFLLALPTGSGSPSPSPGMSESGTPSPGMPESGSPSPGMPESGSPLPGAPSPGMPESGSPMPGTPSPGMPESGSPMPGTPSPGVPESGSPMPGTPSPGMPESGSPMPGSPSPGMPESGSPLPGTPAPGMPEPSSPMPGTPAPGVPKEPPAGAGEKLAADESGDAHDAAEADDSGALSKTAGADADISAAAGKGAESVNVGKTAFVSKASAMVKSSRAEGSNESLRLGGMKTLNEPLGLSRAVTLSNVSRTGGTVLPTITPELTGTPSSGNLPLSVGIPEQIQLPEAEQTAAPGLTDGEEPAENPESILTPEQKPTAIPEPESTPAPEPESTPTPEPESTLAPESAVSQEPGGTPEPSVSPLPADGAVLPLIRDLAGRLVNGDDPRVRIELVAGRPVMITDLEPGNYIVEEINPGAAAVEYSAETLIMRTGDITSVVITNTYPQASVPPGSPPGSNPPGAGDHGGNPPPAGNYDGDPPGNEAVLLSPSPSPKPAETKQIPRTGDEGSGAYWFFLFACAVPAAKSIVILFKKKRE